MSRPGAGGVVSSGRRGPWTCTSSLPPFQCPMPTEQRAYADQVGFSVEQDDFEGRQEASSAEQLHLALSRRFDGGNHFEIAAFGRTYPMLDLMVSDDLAVVHYLPPRTTLAHSRSATSDMLRRPSSSLRTVPVPRSLCRAPLWPA